MFAHILHTPTTHRPWWPTDERFPEAPEKVWTDCCMCKVPKTEAMSRYSTAWDPGIGWELSNYQLSPYVWEKNVCPLFELPTGAYFGGGVETRCLPGKGCNANPRKKCGATLRSFYRFG